MAFKTLREHLGWLYYQYLLVTGVYVLEPWERSLFLSFLLSVVAMVMYTSYVFVPIHLYLALEFFSGICGVRRPGNQGMNGDGGMWRGGGGWEGERQGGGWRGSSSPP